MPKGGEVGHLNIFFFNLAIVNQLGGSGEESKQSIINIITIITIIAIVVIIVINIIIVGITIAS